MHMWQKHDVKCMCHRWEDGGHPSVRTAPHYSSMSYSSGLPACRGGVPSGLIRCTLAASLRGVASNVTVHGSPEQWFTCPFIRSASLLHLLIDRSVIDRSRLGSSRRHSSHYRPFHLFAINQLFDNRIVSLANATNDIFWAAQWSHLFQRRNSAPTKRHQRCVNLLAWQSNFCFNVFKFSRWKITRSGGDKCIDLHLHNYSAFQHSGQAGYCLYWRLSVCLSLQYWKTADQNLM